MGNDTFNFKEAVKAAREARISSYVDGVMMHLHLALADRPELIIGRFQVSEHQLELQTQMIARPDGSRWKVDVTDFSRQQFFVRNTTNEKTMLLVPSGSGATMTAFFAHKSTIPPITAVKIISERIRSVAEIREIVDGYY